MGILRQILLSLRYIYFGGPMPDVPEYRIPFLRQSREAMRMALRMTLPLLIVFVVLVVFMMLTAIFK